MLPSAYFKGEMRSRIPPWEIQKYFSTFSFAARRPQGRAWPHAQRLRPARALAVVHPGGSLQGRAACSSLYPANLSRKFFNGTTLNAQPHSARSIDSHCAERSRAWPAFFRISLVGKGRCSPAQAEGHRPTFIAPPPQSNSPCAAFPGGLPRRLWHGRLLLAAPRRQCLPPLPWP